MHEIEADTRSKLEEAWCEARTRTLTLEMPSVPYAPVAGGVTAADLGIDNASVDSVADASHPLHLLRASGSVSWGRLVCFSNTTRKRGNIICTCVDRRVFNAVVELYITRRPERRKKQSRN